jgi:hypothetical protein
MSGFFGKVTWQGVVTGAVGLIIVSKVLGSR